MTEERDSDHLTETELIMRYGRCPHCWSPRRCITTRTDDGQPAAMELGCSNPDCDPRLLRIE